MNDIALIAAAAAFAGALVALCVYHARIVAPTFRLNQELLSIHDEVLGGGAGAASRRLVAIEERTASLAASTERVEARLRELEALAQTDISRIGFVRYDAFADTGADLSYAFALLNRDGDGVVLSSIYSRTDTRTYGKAVEKFQPAVSASEEELRAIAKAREV